MIGAIVGQKDVLYLSDISSLETDRFGLSSAEAVFTFWSTASGHPAQWAALSAAMAGVVEIGLEHPVFTFLECERRIVQRAPGPGGQWTVRAIYSGIDGSETEPIYDLDLDGNVEPIETHPDFASFAGNSTTPLNGAKFDSDGLFLGFADGTKPEWCGVTSYIRPGAVWTATYYARERPSDLRQVGTIDDPEGYEPNIAQSRNWLYMGVRFQQRGNAVQITKYWKASGPGGWNTSIYG